MTVSIVTESWISLPGNKVTDGVENKLIIILYWFLVTLAVYIKQTGPGARILFKVVHP